MPDGIYLDALELGPERLARKMSDIIKKRSSYNDMFRWHNHYSYHNPLDDPETSGICAFCAALNDEQRRNQTTVYKNIVKWFNDRKDWDLRQGYTTEAGTFAFRENKTFHEKLSTSGRRLYTKSFTNKLITEADDIYHTENDDTVIVFDKQVEIREQPPEFDTSKTSDTHDMFNNLTTQNVNPYLDPRSASMLFTQGTPKPKDMSIRCPDITTCFNTIVSNVQSKLASFFV